MEKCTYLKLFEIVFNVGTVIINNIGTKAILYLPSIRLLQFPYHRRRTHFVPEDVLCIRHSLLLVGFAAQRSSQMALPGYTNIRFLIKRQCAEN